MKTREFLKDIVERYIKHDVSQTAGQIAYFGFLSLFPFIVYMNLIIHQLHLSTGDMMSVLTPLLPQQIANFIASYAEYISTENSAWIMAIGIFSTVFLLSAVIRSMELAVAKAYGIKDRRTFFKSIVVSIISVLCIGLMLVAAAVFIILSRRPVRYVLDLLGLSDMVGIVLILKWAFVIFLMTLVFSLIYKLIPNKKITFSSVVPGTVFAVIGFLVLSAAFGIYVSFAVGAASIYGYIGTVFVALIWIYYIGTIFILGAEINGYFDSKKK